MGLMGSLIGIWFQVRRLLVSLIRRTWMLQATRRLLILRLPRLRSSRSRQLMNLTMKMQFKLLWRLRHVRVLSKMYESWDIYF